ncbi:MAG: DegV family protein [Micrococcus sp.]|nr:DegV family protein [Micrococcus sp.]
MTGIEPTSAMAEDSVQRWQQDYLLRVRAHRAQLVGRARYGLKPPRRDRTAIITDSSAALPGVTRRHPLAAGIRVVPMPVMVGEQIYAEGSDELQAELPFALATGTAVKTSRPSPGRILEEYEAAAQAGYARAVSVHISSGLSGTVDAARVAAEQSPIPVTVVDSQSTGFGLGWTVLDAAVRAGFGQSAESIAEAATAEATSGSVMFTVPNLEQLRRGGRISALSGLLGAMFQIKPVLGLQDGEITLIERTRSADRAQDRLVAVAQERAEGAPARIAVHGYGNRPDALALAERLSPYSETPVPVIDLPAVLAAHLGLGGLGVVVTDSPF